MRHLGPLLATLAVLLLSAAPDGAADISDTTRRTLALPEGRALAVRVSVGDVRITGEARTDVLVEIARRVPDQAQLARVPVAIDERDDRTEIRVLQEAAGTDARLRADVRLRVPAAAVIDGVQIFEGRLEAQALAGTLRGDVRRGPIEASAVSGTLRLSAEIGSVVVRGARLVPGGLIRLRTFNGDVRLELAARPADARIMALALNGTIASEIPLTMKDTWGPRWGETTIGPGADVISIDVVTGKIEIRAPH